MSHASYPFNSLPRHISVSLQMKARAENLDAEMDLLKAAFSEISRLSAEVAIEESAPVTGESSSAS